MLIEYVIGIGDYDCGLEWRLELEIVIADLGLRLRIRIWGLNTGLRLGIFGDSELGIGNWDLRFR